MSVNQVTKLKARDFDNFENLIEEVEFLGISQKKELLIRLITLLEHLQNNSIHFIHKKMPNYLPEPKKNWWDKTKEIVKATFMPQKYIADIQRDNTIIHTENLQELEGATSIW